MFQTAMPKEINLLPKEEFEREPWGKFFTWLLGVGRWIVIATELVVILAFLSRFKLDRDLGELHETIRNQQAIIASSTAFEQDFRSVQTRLSTATKLLENPLEPNEIITSLASVTPPDLALESVSLEKTSLAIEGVALSEGGLHNFAAGLANLPTLTNITFPKVTKTPEKQIQFTVTADLKPQGEKK